MRDMIVRMFPELAGQTVFPGLYEWALEDREASDRKNGDFVLVPVYFGETHCLAERLAKYLGGNSYFC